MRLINTSTFLLVEFFNPEPYAILSHTWRGKDEILYKEFTENFSGAAAKKSFRKIKHLCSLATKEGLEWAWIDTVCIDKSSSSELSEAINSMFAWYQKARVCFVYLEDIDDASDVVNSRWITRGWTLQELLAPEIVRFYNRDWTCIGTKSSLAANLARHTRIDQIVLTDPSVIPFVSAASKFTWAADRQTTRIEDTAYCLLGIFGVNMPLLYGEREKAFLRLQDQILMQHRDLSILAIRRDEQNDKSKTNLLATTPIKFGNISKILRSDDDQYCEVTSRGLHLRLRVVEYSGRDSSCFLVLLDCRYEFDIQHQIALPVSELLVDGGHSTLSHYLALPEKIVLVDRHQYSSIMPKDILILFKAPRPEGIAKFQQNRFICSLKAQDLIAHGFEVLHTEPDGVANSWDPEKLVSEALLTDSILIRKFAFLDSNHDEAFMLMVASERSRNSASMRWDVGEFWVHVAAKPSGADSRVWLEHCKFHDAPKRPSFQSQWATNRPLADDTPRGICGIDGILWHYVPISEGRPSFKINVDLLSDKCYEAIHVEVSEACSAPWHTIVEVRPSRRMIK